MQDVESTGRAWVVFDDVTAATSALRQVQGFLFYDKPMLTGSAKNKKQRRQLPPSAYPPPHGVLGHARQQSQAPRTVVPETPTPPNNILFVQNLLCDANSDAIKALFRGLYVEAKPRIAFVEYGD